MQSIQTEDELGRCEFYMENYINMIERDYRHGWEDCARSRSNLCSSDAYMQGYQDCKYEKEYLNRDFT